MEYNDNKEIIQILHKIFNNLNHLINPKRNLLLHILSLDSDTITFIGYKYLFTLAILLNNTQ